MSGSQDAGGVVDVFQAERYAVQRPAVTAGGDLGLRRARLLERTLRRQSHEPVDLRVQLFYALQLRTDELHRREVAPRNQPGQFGDRERMKFVSHRMLLGLA